MSTAGVVCQGWEGPAAFGTAGLAWPVLVRRGMAGFGKAGKVSRVRVWRDKARPGRFGQACQGPSGSGSARLGQAGVEWLGEAWLRAAGKATRVVAWSVFARQAGHVEVRSGASGLGRLGMFKASRVGVSRGGVRHGLERQAWRGSVGQRSVRQVAAGLVRLVPAGHGMSGLGEAGSA